MKYYKTRRVKMTFQYERREKPVVQLTITAIDAEDAKDADKPTRLLQPVTVDLCSDTHLLEGMVQHFKNLCFSRSGHYIDRFQSADSVLTKRRDCAPDRSEQIALEPIFAALGMDIFEIKASPTEIVRATCTAIHYGFNGDTFYLQAPCSVKFSDRFHENFIAITEAEYSDLMPID